MITTKKITNKEIWVHINDVPYFNEMAGEQLFETVKGVLEEGVNVTIDLDGVNSINSKGYNYLFDIVQKADICRCKIYFSNVNHDIDELIHALTLSSEG